MQKCVSVTVQYLGFARCDYCAAACAGGGSIDVDVTNETPIPVLDGFGSVLVSFHFFYL